MPKLTILLSSFNRPRRLSNSIESVLAQTYQDYRLIVLDDNSPRAEIRSVIESYIEKDSRVSAIYGTATPEYKKNICTFGEMINSGLDSSDSDYVSYLCDSATFLPNRCQQLIDYLEVYDDCDVACDLQHYYRKDAEGNIVHQEERVETGIVEIMNGQSLVDRLTPANFLDHNSIMESRNNIRWSEDVKHWHIIDWERWIRMAKEGLYFHQLNLLGEVKNVGIDSTGLLTGQGKSLQEIIEIRSQ